ncbi:hypothetical protein F5148DRAFT_986907 [Russula earlei]|uniref:Uncharacterized protein n=1 Tax=Russula earlei TaxID=71964 RepID=A0ACC0TWF9_9AGAM|nr:hypothetical protein F5148DRAFT_986907 [Russula earlei]
MKSNIIASLLCLCTTLAQAQQFTPVPLHWLNTHPTTTTGVSWGMPWPQGQVKKNTTFTLLKADGTSQPVQSWNMAYWPDGSIKWTGFAATGDSASDKLSLTMVQGATQPAVAQPIQVNEDAKQVLINTSALQCTIAKTGNQLIPSLTINGKQVAINGQLQCILQNSPDGDLDNAPVRQKLTGAITKVQVEQNGPLRAVVRINGRFSAADGSHSLLPFIVRLYFYAGVQNIRMVHTLIFDGDDQKDFIKGLGLTFGVPLREQIQNRHVRFGGEDDGIWAEPIQPLNGRRPNPYIMDQALGKPIPNAESSQAQGVTLQNMARWNDYKLIQNSADGFGIQKRTNGASSWLDVIGGKRASGLAFAGDISGGLAISLKSFWQSYPAALEINGMCTNMAKINLWMWSPYSDAMDLRHYDTMAHDLNVTYEDVQAGFSTPHGIARTSEIMIYPYTAMPTNQDLANNAAEANNTPLLVTSPEYLHKVGALGMWSLPDRSTKGKQWIEEQLDKALAFYQQEIDRREWYGFWNYGDVMHSYDASRHSWKYDIGGFAWDNTELSTDIWLWYSFLRTGRADIFKMAEAMTRHTSEVDLYHLGSFAGLGSRHNVNHWGDGSKEVRESQAVLRRYYYYLTTDERTGDIMHESAINADSGLLHVDPLREILPKSKYPTHARFGPDWVGLVGNWMTEWERTGDVKWKNKILVGVNDFAKMPHGFYSGKGKDAGMGYDPLTNHMYQLDSNDIGSLHLATLMGGMEMAYELTPTLNNKDFNRLYLQYCSLYGAPLEEVQAAFGKDVKVTLGDPQADYARQPAYVYFITKDAKFAQRAWDQFLPGKQPRFGSTRFDWQVLKGPMVVKPLYEIRNVSTNGTAQWCLNAIELLQLAGDAIPEHNPAWDK